MTSKSTTKTPSKRAPGRPKRIPTSAPRDGVVDTPFDTSNQIELNYGSPECMKKAFVLLRATNCETLTIEFKPTMVNLSSIDHYGKSRINIELNCTNIDRYYCGEITTIHVSSRCLEKIVKVVDKSYTSMQWVVKPDDDKLFINYNTSMNVEECFQLSTLDQQLPRTDMPVVRPQVSFTLPSKYFKKLISDASSFASIITFELSGDHLTYNYCSDDASTISTNHIRDSDSINLHCDLTDGIYRASLALEYIKPISNTLLCDNVAIKSGTNQPFVIQSIIDPGVITVITLTETIPC
jgi:hypothetical protein